jgi:hypothetical protein
MASNPISTLESLFQLLRSHAARLHVPVALSAMLRLAVKHLIGKKLHNLHSLPGKKLCPEKPRSVFIYRICWSIRLNKSRKNAILNTDNGHLAGRRVG